MGRAYQFTVAALGLVVVVAACGQQASSPKSGGGPSGTIHIHLPGNWDQLNPHKMTSTTSWFPVSAMYDRLVFLTADGKYVPYLAKSWQVTPDTLTFTLRTDAVCADGAPVTSAVVVNSFKDFFATSYYAGDFGGPVTVSAPDTDHVILKLAKPNSNILYEFARPHSAGPDGRLSKGGKPLAVTVVGLNTMGDGPDYVQAQLDRLGIQTTLQKVDAGTYSVLKFGNKGDVFLNRFLSDWPTHNVSIVQLNGPSVGAANPQHIESPVIDQAVQAARTTLGAESCRGWATVQRELVGQNYVLPLAVEQVHWFSRKGLNFEPSASVGYTDSLTLRRTG